MRGSALLHVDGTPLRTSSARSSSFVPGVRRPSFKWDDEAAILMAILLILAALIVDASYALSLPDS